MTIHQSDLEEYLEDNIDNVYDDYCTLYELASAISEFKSLLDDGNSLGAIEAIKDVANISEEVKVFIKERLSM